MVYGRRNLVIFLVVGAMFGGCERAEPPPPEEPLEVHSMQLLLKPEAGNAVDSKEAVKGEESRTQDVSKKSSVLQQLGTRGSDQVSRDILGNEGTVHGPIGITDVTGIGGAVSAPPGDHYASVPESNFVAVADSPLSTFSVDVDTASYSNVRRYLGEGTLPPTGSVRVEEMINYFPYSYAAPMGEAPIAANVEVTEAPWAAGHELVRVGIKARELAHDATPARNLVFLVDVSGSMQGEDRLELVKRGLTKLVYQLNARDHVSIVTYAGSAGVVLEPTAGDRSAEIKDAIARLGAGGSTAGAEGIKTAYALAREHFGRGAVNRVILATDGDFNVGVSSDAELTKLIEGERDTGVFLSVLGVGRGNYQDARMEALADKGNGNYAYIDGDAEMRKVLGDQIGATLVTVAKDVKLQVEFNPATVASYRLIGYEDRRLADRDFNDDKKDAGDVGSGHSVTALYEIVPTAARGGAGRPEVDPLKYQSARAATPAAHGDELLTVKVRYKDPEGDTSKLASFVVANRVTSFANATVDTRWAVAVAGFGMLLEGSPNKGDVSWGWVRDTAREARGVDPGGYRAEFLEMVDQAERLRG